MHFSYLCGVWTDPKILQVTTIYCVLLKKFKQDIDNPLNNRYNAGVAR